MIELEGFCHRYGERTVAALPRWRVETGARWLVLGRSGSGKTTLVHALTGLIRPSAGEIVVNGTRLGGLGASAMDRFRGRTFGIVFQTLQLVASLSVRENLALACRLAGKPVDPTAIAALLDRLALGHRAAAKPRNLSTGEAQRAAIARAVITGAPILVADEPTSALDDVNAQRVMQLLFDLAADDRRTLLVVTHDQRLKPLFEHQLVLDAPEAEVAQ